MCVLLVDAVLYMYKTFCNLKFTFYTKFGVSPIFQNNHHQNTASQSNSCNSHYNIHLVESKRMLLSVNSVTVGCGNKFTTVCTNSFCGSKLSASLCNFSGRTYTRPSE